MKEENKQMIIKYLRKEYSRENDKYLLIKHKINTWKQYKEIKDLQIKLGRKFEQNHLSNMSDLSRLIEWVERL
ncbi:MAG: hypothetical protein IKL65_05620 [Bacilli bacterium]|nr:hypothetical protein [Bacilli bacterium]MBR6690792.1 hypothetical protein [Bacilli bacterium]